MESFNQNEISLSFSLFLWLFVHFLRFDFVGFWTHLLQVFRYFIELPMYRVFGWQL